MKTILITGGGSGLGFELAKLYAQVAHVIIIGRHETTLKNAVHQLGSGEYICCDISDESSIKKLKNTLEKRHGSITQLINNAGTGSFGPLVDMTRDQISQMFNVNIIGTITLTQSLLPIITDKVMNIISTAGLVGKVNESIYVASKFAVRGFTESMQKEYENSPIAFTAVYMGGMNTQFWENSTHIKDKSRLQNPTFVAKEIYKNDDGRLEIHIKK